MSDHKSKNFSAQDPATQEDENSSTVDPSLRWQCRRGMLELDVILNRFLDLHYQDLSEPSKAEFIALLEEPDPDLFAWLMGYDQAKPAFVAIVQQVREANASSKS